MKSFVDNEKITAKVLLYSMYSLRNRSVQLIFIRLFLEENENKIICSECMALLIRRKTISIIFLIRKSCTILYTKENI